MKENIETVLLGRHSVLVPYAEHHVLVSEHPLLQFKFLSLILDGKKYHEWMSDAELRELTASEPLTLQEEYDMQQAWQKDDDKLTFIILARHPGDGLPILDESMYDIHLSPEDPRIAVLPMVGDVNLFLKGDRSSAASRRNEGREEGEDWFEVEVEIMIAEKAFRGKRLAIETLFLLLTYTTGQWSAFVHPSNVDQQIAHSILQPYLDHIQATQSPKSLTSIVTPDRLVARISDSNVPSICLFQKLGFKVVKRVQVFHEVEMRWQQA